MQNPVIWFEVVRWLVCSELPAREVITVALH